MLAVCNAMRDWLFDIFHVVPLNFIDMILLTLVVLDTNCI